MWDHCGVNMVVLNYVGIVELVGSSQRLHHSHWYFLLPNVLVMQVRSRNLKVLLLQSAPFELPRNLGEATF